VLIVDDDPAIRHLFERWLSSHGYSVASAADGEAALEAVREQPPDVVLLDVAMPKLSGVDVCRRIKQDNATRLTPVILVSAVDGVADRITGLAAGADDFLSKPFSFVVLVARLRALLRRGVGPRPPVLVVGDLRLDPAARECERDGVPISLTAREFALLEHLMRHHERVVSKGALLAGVWGADAQGDPNLVEVFVGYLRKKVDAPFGRHSVVTVRGAGYRVVDDG
jgi:DNA-binding response OmpR family regulator